jgi:hypothetical protein
MADVKIVLNNVRRLMKGRVRNRPNWALVMEIFGVGSTTAVTNCRMAGIDPEGMNTNV